MKQSKFSGRKPREVFQSVRHRQDDRFNLRGRLTLMVSAELLITVLISFAVASLISGALGSTSNAVMILSLIVSSLVIGSIVTGYLSKFFFEPIKKLGSAMERIADGDFSVRLEDQSSSKELMEVYTGFNLMAHELGAIEMLQSDFVSNVSHEFKTPINAIEGYSMLLQGSENLTPDQEQYVDKILFNTRRLSSLVSSILLLSKLENQQIPTRKTTYRLDEQIRQSIVAKEPDWEQKDVEFDVELEDVQYSGNEPMMRHVWDNLIGNAIKFGPRCGIIRMRLHKKEDRVLFTIEDSGPGLSEEAMKHLYDKFYQADSSHKEEGNGLGLALVKRILALEGGEIRAENIPGGGARFTVEL